MSCIVLCGGIPGSGKTELINFIVKNKEELFSTFPLTIVNGISNKVTADQFLSKESPVGKFENTLNFQIHIIAFDEICSIEDQAKMVKTVMGWRNFRIQLLEAAERYICSVCQIDCQLYGPLSAKSNDILEKLKNRSYYGLDRTKKAIFLVEDNFYYRSMRYEWFQVARREGLGFCQIYLECPLDLALQRNKTRHYQIPEPRIKIMFKSIEFPDPQKYKWEKHSLVFNSSKELKCSMLMHMIHLIQKATDHPAELVLNEKKLEAQTICSKSVLHQSDKVLRKLTGNFITEVKDQTHLSNTNAIVSKIISARQQLLLDIKQGSVTLPEDITENIRNCGINGVYNELEEILRELFQEKCTIETHNYL